MSQVTPQRRRGPWRAGLAATGIAVFVIALLDAVLTRPSNEYVMGVVLIIGSLGGALLARAVRRGVSTTIAVATAAVIVVAEIVWFISGWYPAWVVALIGGFVLAFVLFVVTWAARPRERVHGARRVGVVVGRSVAGVLSLVGAVLAFGLVVNAITPVPLTSAVGGENSFSPAGPLNKKTVLSDGSVRTSDIRYGTKYPNSYLDIYIAKGKIDPDRPTVINVHGGGFITGDKLKGDPATGGGAESNRVRINPFLDNGYNFVSINYALAPGVTYPTPVRQLTQALSFLQDNATTYGLDMDNVIMTGGSAGGQLVSQLMNIQTNPAYAKEMGIAPVLRTTPKAVLLDSALFDSSRGGATESPKTAVDFLFGLSLRAYFGTSKTVAEQANIIDHVTKDFPPTVIADGNTGTFPDQARDFHKKLDRLGVKNEIDVPSKSVATLNHGFMSHDIPQTSDLLKQKFAFLDEVLG